METNLYVITVEHIDSDPFSIFTVGVDMDDETARMIAEREVNEEDVGVVTWEQVPDKIDNFNIMVEEAE